MSSDADRPPRGRAAPVNGAALPESWKRLERAAREASIAQSTWRRRAAEAEEEVGRLRRTLEEVAASEAALDTGTEEVRRLRAENAALRSRLAEARKRVIALMKRLDTLGLKP